MCTTLFAFGQHIDYPLILLSNRDEFHQRRTAPAQPWPESPAIIGGKDLEAGGTWLAASHSGRFGNLTNYRDFRKGLNPAAPTRGKFIPDFLEAPTSPLDFMEGIPHPDHYNGFSLLLGSAEEIAFYSNMGSAPQWVEKGIHGLSNHLLDTPWPKVVFGKAQLTDWINRFAGDWEKLFAIGEDRRIFPDELLPDTGGGLHFERKASPLFILDPIYGTRCISVVAIHRQHGLGFWERRYNTLGEMEGESRWGNWF